MPRLVVEKGPAKGKSVRLNNTSAIVVGRGATADLRLDDPMASRKHFAIEYKKGAFYITDLDSANGTYLNGERIREHILDIDDRIQAGEIILSFLAEQSTVRHDTVTGQTIVGYLIEERVGRGAMGTVYKAVQLSLDRIVALKILARELVKDTSFIDMFVQEAQNAGQLNHPNIVQVYDVGHHENIYYFSMEYMAGGSVYELITREGAQPVKKAIDIAIDSARGLQYGEKRNMVHRDIKPDNLMLTADAITKIGDLGLARHVQPGSTVAEEGIFGSPHYMAPEQAQGLRVDRRTDIYSLGATMYHVLTGKTPFRGKSPKEIILKQINQEPPKLLEVNPTTPEQVADVVQKCMTKDPNDRYQSAEDLLGELEDLKNKVAKGRVRVPTSEKKAKTKARLIPTAVILVAAALAAAGFFIFRGHQRQQQQFTATLRDARDALSSARSLLDEEKPDDVLDALKVFAQKYSDVSELAQEAAELAAEARKLKKEIGTQTLEKKALGAFKVAVQFEKANPEALVEAAEKYSKVAKEFPGTEVEEKAKAKAKQLRETAEKKRQLESAAQAQADMILGQASVFKQRQRFGKALEKLANFPERFSGTAAAKKIDAARKETLKAAKDTFAVVKGKARQMIGLKRYDTAKSLLLDSVSKYEIVEITEEVSKIISEIDKLVEKKAKEEEAAHLAQEEKQLELSVTKARSMIREHRFETAAGVYRSLLLGIQLQKYRDMAKIKLEEIELIKSAMKTLIDQINSKSLARPITIQVNKANLPVVRANEKEIIARFLNVEGTAPRPWDTFSPEEMASFLDACKLDAPGHLAAGVFCKELGVPAEAKKHFDKAIKADKSFADKVKKLSGDLK